MTSPDYAGVEAMVRRTGVAVLASGGVSSVEDIRRLLKTGAEGVVVGSALYRGGLDLAQALEAAREPGA
jgi:phosphoribosylformimino-5-aminoimidazole carboxamide ribonucleotide (ProFAR) isomerase